MSIRSQERRACPYGIRPHWVVMTKTGVVVTINSNGVVDISIGTAAPDSADAVEAAILGISGARTEFDTEAAFELRKGATVRIAYGTQGDIAMKRAGSAGTPLFGSAGLRKNP